MKSVLSLDQFTSRVNEAFQMAELAGMSSTQLHELLTERIRNELYRRRPSGRRVYSSYIAGYVNGQINMRHTDLYRTSLEFCYIGTDGVRYSTHKDRTPNTEVFYQSGRGHELADLPSAHFWIKTGKPFNTPNVFGAEDKVAG